MRATAMVSVKDRVKDALDRGIDPELVPDTVLADATPDVMERLAKAYVSELAWTLVRDRESRERRKAAGKRTPTEKQRRDYEEIDRRHRDRMFGHLKSIIDDYTAEMKVEWTAELLASTFATQDGRRVLWADATIEDHRSHMALIEDQVEGQIRDLALHEKAIQAIEQGGGRCLADVA